MASDIFPAGFGAQDIVYLPDGSAVAVGINDNADPREVKVKRSDDGVTWPDGMIEVGDVTNGGKAVAIRQKLAAGHSDLVIIVPKKTEGALDQMWLSLSLGKDWSVY